MRSLMKSFSFSFLLTFSFSLVKLSPNVYLPNEKCIGTLSGEFYKNPTLRYFSSQLLQKRTLSFKGKFYMKAIMSFNMY